MKTLINDKRLALGYKVNDLAKKIGVDASLMSRIISGQRKPSKVQLKRLSEVLEIDHHVLLQAYLSEEIVNLLKPYAPIASSVLEVAEERIAYLSGKNRLEVVEFTPALKSMLDELNDKRLIWEAKKPLEAIQLEKMRDYFHTAYTFESNRIEGNTLTLSETHLVINEGVTIGGKSMREHLEVINHQEAIALILELVQQKIHLNAYYLKQIHSIVLNGIDKRNAGVYRSVPVRISGSEHVPPEPYLIEKLMEDYFLFYETQKDQLHPVVLAAEMHERLVTIHPFIDGNGRTSRLIMNLILLQNGYTIVNLKGDFEQKLKYFRALEAVQVNHEKEDFHQLIATHALQSLDEHIQLAG
ncbi:MAG: Fic family protein [Crocinitomicaceae bacterium]|nr:Fic family protein [Crocinitomicaceae bacterium]